MDLGNDSKPLPAFYNDPFAPILFASSSLDVSVEQTRLIRELLLLTSSDTFFAQKAADAIRLILSNGTTEVPVITSLEPSTKVVGSTQFKLKAKGTGFSPTCVIHMNGIAVPTLFVSPTELNTDVSLVNVTVPTDYAVVIITGAGVQSNSMIFKAVAA